jgi:hypothetical protein
MRLLRPMLHCQLLLLLRLMLQRLLRLQLLRRRQLLLHRLLHHQPLLHEFGLKALLGALMLPVLVLLVRTFEMNLFY